MRAAALTADAAGAAAAAAATEEMAALQSELESLRGALASAEDEAVQMRQELDGQVAQFHEVRATAWCISRHCLCTPAAWSNELVSFVAVARWPGCTCVLWKH